MKTIAPTKGMKITRRADGYLVETGVFMSDGSYQSGFCKLDNETRTLRFKGWMNRMPFKVSLSAHTFAAVLDIREGEFACFAPQ